MTRSNKLFGRLLRRVALPGLALSGLTILSDNIITLKWFTRDTTFHIDNFHINQQEDAKPNSSPPSSDNIMHFEPIITITLPDIDFNPEIVVDNNDAINLDLENIQLDLPPNPPNIQLDSIESLNDGVKINPILRPVSYQPDMNTPSDDNFSAELAIYITRKVNPPTPLVTVLPRTEKEVKPLPVKAESPSNLFEPTREQLEPMQIEWGQPHQGESPLSPIPQQTPALFSVKKNPVSIPEPCLRGGWLVLGILFLLQRRG